MAAGADVVVKFSMQATLMCGRDLAENASFECESSLMNRMSG
jgi:hypothetical protein